MSTSSALPRQNTFGGKLPPLDPPGSPGWWCATQDRASFYAKVHERAEALALRYGCRQESVCSDDPDAGFRKTRSDLRRAIREGRNG